jgi:hypothetical protein
LLSTQLGGRIDKDLLAVFASDFHAARDLQQTIFQWAG